MWRRVVWYKYTGIAGALNSCIIIYSGDGDLRSPETSVSLYQISRLYIRKMAIFIATALRTQNLAERNKDE